MTTPFKVYIDGTILTSSPEGGAYVFLKELLPRLAKCPEIELELVSPSPLPETEKMEGIKTREPIFSGGSLIPHGKVRRFLGRVKRGLAKSFNEVSSQGKEGINFSTYYMPVPSQPQRRELSVIYDMIVEKFPDWYDKDYALNFSEIKKKNIERASRFVAISQKTKEDLCEIAGISPEKVDVVPLAYNPDIFYAPEKKLFAKQPYLLYIGGRLNHKNFISLLEAFAGSSFEKDLVLKVAGHSWNTEEEKLLQKYGLKNRVELEVKPSFERVAELYREATCFVYPSLYEGFGLPLLEAMASGCAIAASRTGSLPEVGGEAAVYFDPKDPADIRNKIETLLDKPANQKLVSLGLERVKEFSWERNALGIENAILKMQT